MQDIIHFLVQNPDVVQKVKEGTASLVGVSLDEVKIILDLVSDTFQMRAGYWQ